MKKIAFTLLSLLIAASVGCQKVSTLDQPLGESQTIAFTGDITKGTTEDVDAQSAATRADATKSKAAFITGDQIGVFVVPFKTALVKGDLIGSGNYADNVPFVCAADGKFAPTAANTITFPTAKTHVSLYAFAMYNATFNTLGANPKVQVWTIDEDQTAANGSAIVKNDLMTAQAPDVAPGTTPNLSFAHRMAMVRVDLTTLAMYRGSAVISASLAINNVIVDAVVDMTDNTVAAVSSGASKKTIKAFQLSSAANATAGLDCVYEAVVVPQIVPASTVGATVTLVTATGSYDFKCELSSAITYKSGNLTKISLKFENEHKLTIQSVSIVAWGDGGSTSVEARQPAIMNFTVATDPYEKAKTIRYAVLGIDNDQYTADVEYSGGVLRCAYMQSLYKVGDKIKSLNFLDASSNAVSYQSATPAITPTGLNIPGNPTQQGYAEIISVLTFN